MGKIPDRWLPYRALGRMIKGTRFVAFKVPLSEKLSKGLPEKERFTPDILVATCPKLSLVVDLTNTYRYYDKREFTSKSVHYEKICVPGKECPTSELVHRFFEIVDKFMESEDNTADSLIGVHCTHGVNRTGYFICRYMIQRLGFDPVTALQAFQEGRGYPIERENYIKDLKKCFRNKAEHAEEGSVKANNPYRSAEKTNLYRTRNTYSSHKSVDARSSYRTSQTNNSSWSVNKNRSYTTAETNNSYMGSNTNTSWRNEKRRRDKILLSGQGYTINRNYQAERKYEPTSPYNKGHTVSRCNYNRKYSSEGGRNYRHTSSYNTGTRHKKKPGYSTDYTKNSDVSHRDQSGDWRTNNPYMRRNLGGLI